MNTAIYARYSSRLQRPTSIEDQVHLCQKAAPGFGCTILPDHIYTDHEQTGSEERRPGYQQLLQAARHQAVEAIIVEAQDRLWRNQAEMHQALRQLAFWKVKVFSVSSGQDLTASSGRVLATVFGLKDELYLDDLREKTRRGLAGQIRRGFTAGGRAYGYRTEPVLDASRRDVHGQPAILGYRRVIVPEEAEWIRWIFEQYAAGRSQKQIALDLNRRGIPAPRSRHGWTWTAIYGSPRLGTGILRNRLYIGEATFGRFAWVKDPETGKRVPRKRSPEDWVVHADDTLRIVPQDLWDAVRAREQRRSEALQPHRRGQPPKYLFSGLLVCGICGAHFIMRDVRFYACSFHLNRGPTVCTNTRVVSRRVVEQRLLAALREQVFTPQAVAYITRRVNDGLRARAREQQSEGNDRSRLALELAHATQELAHIRDAIRAGLLSDLTREMLQETEARIRDLRARLEAPRRARVHAFSVRPEMILRQLDDLHGALEHDIDRARAILRQLLGDIILQPMAEGLVAELQGNVQGLLALDQKALGVGNLVAGAGFEPATFGL